MLSKLKVILGLLSFAGIASKVGFLFGPFGAVFGSIFAALVATATTLTKWFFNGVTVIVSNPVTLVAVAVAAALAFGGGVKLGKEYDEYLVQRKEAVIQKMLSDSKRLDDENKSRLAKSLGAKAAAEAEAAKIEVKPVATTAVAADTVQPAAAKPKRVRPARADCKDSGSGSSLQWPGLVWGGPAPCKP